MASPGQKRETCGHSMALFDSHSKCARCCEKGLGPDPYVEKRTVRFVIVLLLTRRNSWPSQPTEREKSTRRPPPRVDPADITVLGQVESGKGDSSNRDKTPFKKKKSSHKSPSMKSTMAGKTADFQSDLKNLDDKWSEPFSWLEALFLVKSFSVLVEPVQK